MKVNHGFTLVELLIVVAVTGIILAVAYPSYQAYLLQSHRSDGTTTLLAMQLAEEKYRFNNTTYGTLDQVWGGVSTSTLGYYTVSISGNTGTAYTLTATGVGHQASDASGSTTCSPLMITVSGGTVTKSPSACW